MLGVMETRDAFKIAREKDLDLVEVNPKAFPPVCKIMDFGKFKYEEAKKTREAKKKQTVVKLKEIKLRPKTDEHDIDFKVKHIRNFIAEGDKVKITVRFRGREITHPETAQRQFETIIDRVKDVAIVESSSRMEGRAMIVLLAPRPAGSKGGNVSIRPTVVTQVRREQPPVSTAPVNDEVDDDEDDEDDTPDDAEAAEAAETAARASAAPPAPAAERPAPASSPEPAPAPPGPVVEAAPAKPKAARAPAVRKK
jgi:translation initiation factor IF-3